MSGVSQNQDQHHKLLLKISIANLTFLGFEESYECTVAVKNQKSATGF